MKVLLDGCSDPRPCPGYPDASRTEPPLSREKHRGSAIRCDLASTRNGYPVCIPLALPAKEAGQLADVLPRPAREDRAGGGLSGPAHPAVRAGGGGGGAVARADRERAEWARVGGVG